MSHHRFYQLQTEAVHGSRSSSPHRSSHSHSSHKSSHRPQPQTTPNYQQRTSTSSDSSNSSGASSYGSSYNYNYNYSYADSQQQHYSTDQAQPRVEVMRCSRCAKCVETITSARSGDDLRRVSTADASASGMVRFGHNLYYCDRCARMVGYK